jgi:hypothetical protein
MIQFVQSSSTQDGYGILEETKHVNYGAPLGTSRHTYNSKQRRKKKPKHDARDE